MIRSLLCTVFLHQRDKLLNAKIIITFRILAPVSCRLLTHKIHLNKRFNHFILNHGKCLSLLLPWGSGNLFKLFFELLKSALTIQLAFKLSKIRNGTAISLHLIEHFHKNFHDSLLAGAYLCRTFRINVKQHNIG
ncbi:unknown [Roseburia sp. CAG:309]|nr:unknown [Roseburia sp. CAG:309]